MQRFPISFERWYAALSTLLGLPPAAAYVDVGERQVEIRMGWAFRALFPRTAVADAVVLNVRPLSRGVHGWGGRWLVNGSGRGIVSIRLRTGESARMLGVPVRLCELLVSVVRPAELAAALKPSA